MLLRRFLSWLRQPELPPKPEKGFEEALIHILRVEGGYVDDPRDLGGATNYGITQATYNKWRRTRALPTRSVREIERGEVSAIYHQYWHAFHCSSLPWPLSLLHFDAAVNHAPSTAWTLLQRAVGVRADGRWGPETYNAAIRAKLPEVAFYHLLERLKYFRHRARVNRSQVDFFVGGWTWRLIELYLVIRED